MLDFALIRVVAQIGKSCGVGVCGGLYIFVGVVERIRGGFPSSIPALGTARQ